MDGVYAQAETYGLNVRTLGGHLPLAPQVVPVGEGMPICEEERSVAFARVTGVRLTRNPQFGYDPRSVGVIVPVHPSSQFRRSGQRDDRRRRVLSEPLLVTEVGQTASRRRVARRKQPPRKSENYGDAAFMDEQARLTDLIPRSLWAHLLVFLSGVTILVGLELLYLWMPSLGQFTRQDGRVAAFDLDGEGSLAVWFSSTTLTLAALVAVIVFTVRRHRRDDYHGRYRVWLWAAMCWLLMSLDETASLHEGFKEMMTLLTGNRIVGDGSLWWVAAYIFLLGAVGTRLLIDMRECWLSSAAFLGTAVCYALAVATQLQLVLPETGAKGVMLEEGAEMLGNLLLLAAMGLHARFVIMDAEGLIRRRPKVAAEPAVTKVLIVSQESARELQGVDAPEEIEQEEPEPAAERPLTIHPPHGVSRPTGWRAKRRRAEPKPAFVATDEPEDQPETKDDPPLVAPVQRKLTKAEKKALRRRLKKLARERERQRRAG